jgi:hypothetical protein
MERVTATTQRLSRKVGDAIHEGTDCSSLVHAKNLFDVQGRVALVTGKYGALSLRDISDRRSPRRRFWHRFAQALAMHGAKVYIVGRSQEKLDKVLLAMFESWWSGSESFRQGTWISQDTQWPHHKS